MWLVRDNREMQQMLYLPFPFTLFCKQITGRKHPHLPYYIIIRYHIFRKIICNILIILPVKRMIAKIKNNCRYINCPIR